MRSLKWKCLVLMMAAVFAAVSVTGFAEAAAKRPKRSRRNTDTTAKAARVERRTPKLTSDDVIGENMLKLAEALRKTSELERERPSTEARREKLEAQYDAEIAELERKIAELERKRDSLSDSEVSEDARIDEAFFAAQDEADAISDILSYSFDMTPENVNAFHPEASSQIVGWELTQDETTEEELLNITILHNRGSQRITRMVIHSELTESRDIFFTVKNLPEGLQIVIPEGDGNSWTVAAEGRNTGRKSENRNNFAAKIVDTEDIPYSKLDSDSNLNDDGSKTFKPGEAFIILRNSTLIIRPAH